MSTWSESLRVYRQSRLLAVFFMGFSSGLPLSLTAGTLSVRLAKSGIPLAAIGLFALVGTPYSTKFLWAPFLDQVTLPWPLGPLGRRRSWAILIQCLLIGAILALGWTEPTGKLWMVALAAGFVAFLSASQDIVIDALRIELLRAEEQGAGVVATQYGYRLGMIVASATALYAAERSSWLIAHCIVALLLSIGIVTVLQTPEPTVQLSRGEPARWGIGDAVRWLRETVLEPFREFLARPGAVAILAFVVLYKFGDALLGVMANPFYVKVGFTNAELALISTIFGFSVTFVGFLAGGAVVYRFGFFKSMLVCGILQMLSNLLYVAQTFSGHDPWMLTLTIGVDNFAGGMGSVAFIAYLSSLCNVAFTGTQYALLSSIATLARNVLVAPLGWLPERLGWVTFFVLTTVAALPGIALLLVLMRRFPQQRAERPVAG
jgi:PAT family beta-lactamase induction signal transducer AmpG